MLNSWNQPIQMLFLQLNDSNQVFHAQLNNSNEQIQVLQAQLNNSNQILHAQLNEQSDILQAQLNQSSQQTQIIFQDVQEIRAAVTVSSCSDISQSGEYLITDTTGSLVRVYCDMDRTSCSCNTAGLRRWMRVANLDMTDPNQNCPDGFRLVSRTTPPLRTSGRPGPAGCVSTTYPTYGVEYSRVCGRVTGYQDKTPDAFQPYSDNRGLTIDDLYVDGVSLTHGQSPRQHIWTFANALDEIPSRTNWVCPCTRLGSPYTGAVPSFIGEDYFCETGSRQAYSFIFYSDDPVWDGQGCGSASTCCQFNNPPWFCKQLPQPTTDDIELRICANDDISDEDTPLEIVEIFVQ